MRRCIGCMETRPKSEMARIVLDGEVPVFDRSGKMDGRGVYICPDPGCTGKAVKRKALNRAFRRAIDKDICEALFKEITETC